MNHSWTQRDNINVHILYTYDTAKSYITSMGHTRQASGTGIMTRMEMFE